MIFGHVFSVGTKMKPGDKSVWMLLNRVSVGCIADVTEIHNAFVFKVK